MGCISMDITYNEGRRDLHIIDWLAHSWTGSSTELQLRDSIVLSLTGTDTFSMYGTR